MNAKELHPLNRKRLVVPVTSYMAALARRGCTGLCQISYPATRRSCLIVPHTSPQQAVDMDILNVTGNIKLYEIVAW